MDNYLKNIGTKTITKNNYLLANSYDIKEFNLEQMMDITGGIVAIISMTGAGKTVLLKDLLSKTHKNYDKIYLFSRTAKLQSAYDFVPRSFITDDYDEEKITEIWNSQVKDNLNGLKMKNVLIILDDIIASQSYKKSKMIDEIAFGARHCNITLIILSQNFTSIRLSVRGNVRIAIAFDLASKKEREKFCQQFLSSENDKIGEIVFKNITKTKYQSIIICNYMNGAPLEEKTFRYIADPSINIKLKEPEEERIIKPEIEMIRPSRIIVKKKKY